MLISRRRRGAGPSHVRWHLRTELLELVGSLALGDLGARGKGLFEPCKVSCQCSSVALGKGSDQPLQSSNEPDDVVPSTYNVALSETLEFRFVLDRLEFSDRGRSDDDVALTDSFCEGEGSGLADEDLVRNEITMSRASLSRRASRKCGPITVSR